MTEERKETIVKLEDFESRKDAMFKFVENDTD